MERNLAKQICLQLQNSIEKLDDCSNIRLDSLLNKKFKIL